MAIYRQAGFYPRALPGGLAEVGATGSRGNSRMRPTGARPDQSGGEFQLVITRVLASLGAVQVRLKSSADSTV
jgi:hypothetical protein